MLMPTVIEGVNFERHDNYAICHVNYLSDEIKRLIKNNLTVICHGTHILGYGECPLYSYKTTLNGFLKRYKKKPQKTQIGMIGEFLSHILITELFKEFKIVSAFFNLEEKSIKKGFDILLYEQNKQSIWITEIKSGNLHTGKNPDQTISELLATARNDLQKRLNEPEPTYWYNAINSVRATFNDEKDYKKILEKILREKGSDTADGDPKGQNHCVTLVASLFEPLISKISISSAKSFSSKLSKEKFFSECMIFCIQKGTYEKIVTFIETEAIK